MNGQILSSRNTGSFFNEWILCVFSPKDTIYSQYSRTNDFSWRSTPKHSRTFGLEIVEKILASFLNLWLLINAFSVNLSLRSTTILPSLMHFAQYI